MLRLVVATSLVVLVAGCTDPAPKEPKPTTSATPTATAPTMPAQAKENTPEGASAFVAYYVDVLNHAAATGQVDVLSRLSSADCGGCQSYIDLYRDTYAAGGYFKGGLWAIGELKLVPNGSEILASTRVKTSATKYRKQADAPEQSGPAESNTISFAVSGSAENRQVSQLALGDAS